MYYGLHEPVTCTYTPAVYCTCGEEIPWPERAGMCDNCDAPMCNGCVVKLACETCDTACCDECITICDHCGARLCPTCKESGHLPECATCGSTLCGWCADECDECGTPMCSECCGNGCEAHTRTPGKETA